MKNKEKTSLEKVTKRRLGINKMIREMGKLKTRDQTKRYSLSGIGNKYRRRVLRMIITLNFLLPKRV